MCKSISLPPYKINLILKDGHVYSDRLMKSLAATEFWNFSWFNFPGHIGNTIPFKASFQLFHVGFESGVLRF